MLEVLTGVPVRPGKGAMSASTGNGQELSFSIETPIPLGKAVATTTLFTDVLAGAPTVAFPP